MDEPADLPDELTSEQKHFSDLCGPPPLIDGEDAARCRRLLVGVVKALTPADVPEWLWVRDIVDLEWEILRYRSAKARLITAAKTEACRYLNLNTMLDDSPSAGFIGRNHRPCSGGENHRPAAFRPYAHEYGISSRHRLSRD